MRAALEAMAMGVRHNLEAFDSVRPGESQWRPVAVGGGVAGALWPRIVAAVSPRPELADLYDRRYAVYRDLYTATRPLIARL